MIHVNVKPELITWARQRSRSESIFEKFPKLSEWEKAISKPTLKQLEAYAKATHTPIGYFFLQHPPEIMLPIPDFRTIGNRMIPTPTPDLLDTIYLCEQRQEWYRTYLRSMGADKIDFIGSVSLEDSIEEVASKISKRINFGIEERKACSSKDETLRTFIERVEDAGILVMVNGVVGNNNNRKLDPREFRGFVLCDDLAPLIFVNGADTKSAQMFTIAHELAHLWLGKSGITDASLGSIIETGVEDWCNRCAAEILVPMDELSKEYNVDKDQAEEIDRLARLFKVSTLVIVRRAFDLGVIEEKRLHELFEAEMDRSLSIVRGSGGNFYHTEIARVSKTFARALVTSTLEGQTLYTESFRMLGFSKMSTFIELGRNLGVG